MTRAHIITGSFGAGKTTAIRRLMQDKPEAELWVVILNEFTDAGLDALTVAEAARGRFDVRLVAGGCLCCVGEAEFGRELAQILGRIRPTRLLIEPSGAGHAGDIVDELSAFESRGLLTVDSIVCLIDPIDALRLAQSHARATQDQAAWSQVQSADVLLLSKADVADAAAQEAFAAIAAAQFPAKSHVGRCANGVLPAAALAAYVRAPAFTLAPEGGAAAPESAPFPAGPHCGVESQVAQLGLHACSWILPGALAFDREILEPRLAWLLEAHGGLIRRFKAVFRMAQGPSWMVQAHGRGLAGEDSAYRRDSRVELVLTAPPTPQFLVDWRGLLRDACGVGGG